MIDGWSWLTSASSSSASSRDLGLLICSFSPARVGGLAAVLCFVADSRAGPRRTVPVFRENIKNINYHMKPIYGFPQSTCRYCCTVVPTTFPRRKPCDSHTCWLLNAGFRRESGNRCHCWKHYLARTAWLIGLTIPVGACGWTKAMPTRAAISRLKLPRPLQSRCRRVKPPVLSLFWSIHCF